MSTTHILVIGASGGIGRAVVKQFASQFPSAVVHAVSRSKTDFSNVQNVTPYQIATDDETEVANWCASLGDVKFSYVVGAMGVLHGDHKGVELSPEKKLEDLNLPQLSTYFQINSIVPALWLKHLVKRVDKTASVICFISARVGSITDNKMGGWYGYRASKSALNMLMKTANIEYRRRTKHTALVSYHPGTVDTGLSKPFQSNVKENKLFEPAFTAERLINILATLNVDDGPYYLDWDNKTIPW